MAVQDIRLEKVDITATRGIELIDVQGFQFENVRWQASQGPALHLHNARDVRFRHCTVGLADTTAAMVTVNVGGPLTEAVDLSGLTAPGARLELFKGPNIAPDDVHHPARSNAPLSTP